jgi:hypothetical protein
VTDFEKKVYNTWLATTRSKNNKPFRLRKDWTSFEDRPEYLPLKKLANMFKRFDNIIINEWFEAPYEIYKQDDTPNYDLRFYTSAKAFNCYKLHKTKFKNITSQEFHRTLFKNKQTEKIS